MSVCKPGRALLLMVRLTAFEQSLEHTAAPPLPLKLVPMPMFINRGSTWLQYRDTVPALEQMTRQEVETQAHSKGCALEARHAAAELVRGRACVLRPRAPGHSFPSTAFLFSCLDSPHVAVTACTVLVVGKCLLASLLACLQRFSNSSFLLGTS